MLKILRLEQWSKNLVLFLPAIFSNNLNKLFEPKILMVFIGFSLSASATYIYNDIQDYEQDRMHPIKKNRPIASSKIDINFAKIYGIVLLLSGFLIVSYANLQAIIYLVFYLLLTVLYSKKLKYLKYLDFLTITILFSVRLFLGSFITSVSLTNYLSLFTIFSINQIVLAKKISIMNNPRINSKIKVKKFLISKYKNNEIRNILKISIVISNLTLLAWSINWFQFGLVNTICASINLILIFYFNFRIYNDSIRHQVEDFIFWILSTRLYLLLLISALLILQLLY